MYSSSDLLTAKLRPAHSRILFVASLGQFLGQGLATLVGIIIPLLALTLPQGLPSGLQGILGCISLIGIMIGSAVIGNLSDRYGYLTLFRICPVVCGLSALAIVLFPYTDVLAVSLFIMGFAVGGEYSLDPNYISELMPSRWKVFMVGVAKAVASVGSAFVAITSYIIMCHYPHPRVWSFLMLIIAGICLLMTLSRIRFAQSPQWLADHGKRRDAEAALEKLLGPGITLPKSPTDGTPAEPAPRSVSIGRFILSHFRLVVLTGVPWAFEGLGVYGIGIFLPILIMAFGLDDRGIDISHVDSIAHSVLLTFVLCLVMLVGFVFGLLMLRRIRHLHIQIIGFWLSAAGLGILLGAYMFHWHTAIAILGFIIFELSLNAGPHLITFILPSLVFHVSDRGTGAGVAACIGKAGAVAGTFFIPVILHQWGTEGVLIVSIAVMALGAIITRLFRPNKLNP